MKHRIVTRAGRDCIDTGKLVIGVAHVPGPIQQFSADALKLQRALLDKRTTTEPTPMRRIAAGVWNWL